MGKYKNLKANIVFAVLFVALSLFMIFIAIPSQISLSAKWSTVDSGVDSRTFPYIACVIMGSAALVQLISNVRKYIELKKANQEIPGEKIVWANEIRAILVFVLCVAYGILFDTVGYILATLIIPPIVLFVMGSRKWYHYLSVYGVGVIMYVVFIFLLNIRLP